MRFLLIKNLVKILAGNYFLSIFMLLQGCNLNNFGQELSNSFDQPEMKTKLNSKNRKLEEKKPAKKIDKSTARNLNDKAKKSDKLISRSKLLGLKKVTYNPKPYRITIKLSGANPSSPSQSVTNALIKAGVKFEVEMVERVEESEAFNASSKRGNRR